MQPPGRMKRATPGSVVAAAAACSRSFWLVKSEPSDYSITMMESEHRTVWDGVRNAQARKNLRAMNVGDRCLFYHSSCAKTGIAGIVSVAKAAYPDPADSAWAVVDMQHEETWNPLLPLAALKAHTDGALNGLVLLRQPRLSVQPVTEEHFSFIEDLYRTCAEDDRSSKRSKT